MEGTSDSLCAPGRMRIWIISCNCVPSHYRERSQGLRFVGSTKMEVPGSRIGRFSCQPLVIKREAWSRWMDVVQKSEQGTCNHRKGSFADIEKRRRNLSAGDFRSSAAGEEADFDAILRLLESGDVKHGIYEDQDRRYHMEV